MYIGCRGCETFDSIMHTAMRALKAFMEKGVRSEVIQGIDYPDIFYGQYGHCNNMPRKHLLNIVRQNTEL